MDSSSNTNTSNSFESPQPHKKRKISSQKSKSIHYATRSQSNKNKNTKNNKNKRRLNNTNSSRNNKNKSNKKSQSLRDKVEPWWIGQRIIVQIPDPKNNTNNKKSKIVFTKIGREATIRDYNPNTQLSHIWFETQDNNFENVDLLKLEDWDIPNDKPIHKQIQFVPNNEWIPPKWEMKQRVLVKFDGKYGTGSQFAAFIDGYDPISRRHHINYGDTTEWIWANKGRVQIFKGKKCDNYIEEKLKNFRKNRDEVTPPPWNPIPYGLDETFEIRSKEIQQIGQPKPKQKPNNYSNIVSDASDASDNKKPRNMVPVKSGKQPVKIFANKTHPRRTLNDNGMTNGSKRTSALMKKTKSISLNKLLKSNHSKLENKNRTRRRRPQRKHSNNKEKQESEDTIMNNNNDSGTGTSVSSSSSSSESTFDTKTYQDMTDSDNDIKMRKQRTSNNKNNTQNKDKKDANKHIQVSILPMLNNTQKSSKKQPKKKKISLRIPKKAITKTNNTNNTISKTKNLNTEQQTQTLPMHLQHLPITHSINTINTINTNINNTVSRPIVLHQLPLQSMMPTISNNMPLFIPNVQQQNILQKPTLLLKKQKKYTNNKEKKKLYPRIAIIKGEKWIRHYSKSDRKYYWLLHNDKNDIVDKEWDPWRKHGEKAPWMISMQKWGKFKDPNEKKEYYYNYETKQSTFKRPKGFESDAEIQYDSADDSYNKKWKK